MVKDLSAVKSENQTMKRQIENDKKTHEVDHETLRDLVKELERDVEILREELYTREKESEEAKISWLHKKEKLGDELSRLKTLEFSLRNELELAVIPY
jgi:hypothetical protein